MPAPSPSPLGSPSPSTIKARQDAASGLILSFHVASTVDFTGIVTPTDDAVTPTALFSDAVTTPDTGLPSFPTSEFEQIPSSSASATTSSSTTSSSSTTASSSAPSTTADLASSHEGFQNGTHFGVVVGVGSVLAVVFIVFITVHLRRKAKKKRRMQNAEVAYTEIDGNKPRGAGSAHRGKPVFELAETGPLPELSSDPMRHYELDGQAESRRHELEVHTGRRSLS